MPLIIIIFYRCYTLNNHKLFIGFKAYFRQNSYGHSCNPIFPLMLAGAASPSGLNMPAILLRSPLRV